MCVCVWFGRVELSPEDITVGAPWALVMLRQRRRAFGPEPYQQVHTNAHGHTHIHMQTSELFVGVVKRMDVCMCVCVCVYVCVYLCGTEGQDDGGGETRASHKATTPCMNGR